MRPRKVDLAFEWMRSQPPRAFHYRDELWAALADLYPAEFAETSDRKTPWSSLFRDMAQDRRFLHDGGGMFELRTSVASMGRPLDTDLGSKSSDGQTISSTLLRRGTTDGSEPALDEMMCRPRKFPPESVLERTLFSEASAREPKVWIFQANPDKYWWGTNSGDRFRIIEVLQRFNRLQFLTNEYRERIDAGDLVLLWKSGHHAGIYAQARVVAVDAKHNSEGEGVASWVDPSCGRKPEPRVVLEIEKRFIGNPVLKTTIEAKEGLKDLAILHQPTCTNFSVAAKEWALLQALVPADETNRLSRETIPPTMKRARGGRLYDESCNKLLERYVAETFEDGKEHSHDEITAWFYEKYPLFKPTTVECHIAKYTTNFRSRLHYGATAEHDLLYRVDGDWSRLRLYRPGEDPEPFHDKPDTLKPWKRRVSPKVKQVSPLEFNRRLLSHLATFGELAPGDLEDLGLDEEHLGDWLDSLLARRPDAYVVTPLFLHLIEGDAGSCSFTTRLAARFMGEHLRCHATGPIPELEEHVWTRFGRWHLTQPHGGDEKTHAYLAVPIHEPRSAAASERLDLFARLPSKVIGDLIREPEFLTEQQSWSADAASKSSEGPLSVQLRRSWKRPLLLSVVDLLVADDGQVLIGEMERADVAERSYIVSGLSLCASDDWEPAATLDRETAAERLCQHPLARAVLQFEVHGLFAGLSGGPAPLINVAEGTAQLEFDGVTRGPLWRHVRSLLEQTGYWPVGASTQDPLWTSAVRVMLRNLELLDVLKREGDVLRLTDAYQSKIKAHPGHPQNRGEKAYRVRLSQYLAALQGVLA